MPDPQEPRIPLDTVVRFPSANGYTEGVVRGYHERWLIIVTAHSAAPRLVPASTCQELHHAS